MVGNFAQPPDGGVFGPEALPHAGGLVEDLSSHLPLQLTDTRHHIFCGEREATLSP